MTNKEIYEVYRQGFEDGLTGFAWWKDGVQYVGTGDTILKQALIKIEDIFNFNPPYEDKP